MRKSNFCVLLLVLLTSTTLASYEAVDYQTIVMFEQGAVTVTSSQDTANVDSVSFDRSALKDILTNLDVDTLIRAFPGWPGHDSTVTSPLNSNWTGIIPRLDNVFRLVINDPTDRDSLVARLQRDQDVVFACKNGGIELNSTWDPDDPYYTYNNGDDPDDYQWGLKYHSPDSLNDPDIDADSAWYLARQVLGVDFQTSTKISIFDTGVWTNHEDFNGRVDQRNDPPLNQDYTYHGTSIAGIIGAETDNETGIAGVHPGINMDSYNVAVIDDRIEWFNSCLSSINRGAILSQCSAYLTEDDPLLRLGYSIAYDCGILPVVARGNEGDTTAEYPACFGDYIFSVGAITCENADSIARAGFSSYGFGLDLLAPGWQIVSTYTAAFPYHVDTGTSLSAPFVSGTAALLYDYHLYQTGGTSVGERLRSEDLHEILKRTAYNGYDNYNATTDGAGFLKADDALRFITEPNYLYYHIQANAAFSNYGFTDTLDIWWLDYIWSSDICEDVVKREVRADIEWADYPEIVRSFPDGRVPDVWVIGESAKTGYQNMDDGDTSWGIRHCDVLNVDEDGATLRTWIYYYNDDWYPCAANQLDVYFTLVGYNPAPGVPTGLSASEDPATGCVRLTWDANDESDLEGYLVARKIDAGDFEEVATTSDTFYVDDDLDWTTWQDFDHATYYKVLAYDDVGAESDYCTPILQATNDPQKGVPGIHVEEDLPIETTLLPNYPNPFNSITTVQYALAKQGAVNIRIFNVIGEEVFHYMINQQSAGKYSVSFDFSQQSSGLYLIKAELEDRVFNQKVLLIK